MPGEPDPLYVAARSVLLDAIEALGPQRDAVILVGAQAIYLYTGAIELPIAEHTTDADIAIDPALLKRTPEIESALTSAGFFRGGRIGAWVTTKEVEGRRVRIEVDLMVPEAVSGPGRRAARLAGHADRVARKARGLEAALVEPRDQDHQGACRRRPARLSRSRCGPSRFAYIEAAQDSRAAQGTRAPPA